MRAQKTADPEDGYDARPPEELAAGAELLAGRLDVAGCRRWLDV